MNYLRATLTCIIPFLFILNSSAQRVLLTEIMYNPPESGIDSLEYIELYNPQDTAINLKGYRMEGVNYEFDSVTIAAKGIIILAEDSTAMKNTFNISTFQWESGSLNNQGERLAILDSLDQVVNEVTYDVSGDWPGAANGEGTSLILCDILANSNEGTNWATSAIFTGDTINNRVLFGSPGVLEKCLTREIDTLPPMLDSVMILSRDEILLLFNEPIDTLSIDTSEFSFIPTVDIVMTGISDTIDSGIRLKLGTPLLECVAYSFAVSGVADLAFNTIDSTASTSFSYCPPDTMGPSLTVFEWISPQQVLLVFNEPLDTAILVLQDFSLTAVSDTGGVIPIIDSIFFTNSADTLTLQIKEPISTCVEYKVAYEVADTLGNISLDQSKLAAAYCPQTIALTITEIMYNPPEAGFDFLEFIEILNTGNNPADMSRVTLEGLTIDWDGVILPPDSFLIIASDVSSFSQIYGISGAVGWNFGENLSNNGTLIALRTEDGTLLDEVSYSNSKPWPTEADGTGTSLILCDIEKDNNAAINWSVSQLSVGITVNGRPLRGSPGFLEACPPPIGTPDTIPPTLISSEILGNQLTLIFNEPIQPLDQASQVDIMGSQINTIELSDNGNTLVITFDTLPPPCEFLDIALTGISDTSVNVMEESIEIEYVSPCQEIPPLVITEILYEFPSNDTLRFVEIYHSGFIPVNLRSYKLAGDIAYVFPDSVILPGEYVVISQNVEAFDEVFGGKVWQWESGTLSGEIQLLNPSGLLVEEVSYLEELPWPENPVNSITSLEMKNALLDNSLPESWQRSEAFVGYFQSDTVKATPGFAPFNGRPAEIDMKDTVICGVDSFLIDIQHPESIYLWSTGDTTQSIVVKTSGSYEVKVNNGFSADSEEFRVTILPELTVADIIGDTLCVDSIIVFENPAPNASYWLWDFGNGDRSSESTSSTVYNDVGVYEISLEIGNETEICPSVTDTLVITTCNITTSIQPLIDAKWEVYPNPVRDMLNITWRGGRPIDGSIHIIDFSGRNLYTYTWERENEWEINWDASSLPSGLYYVILREEDTYQSLKMVK